MEETQTVDADNWILDLTGFDWTCRKCGALVKAEYKNKHENFHSLLASFLIPL